MTSWLHEERLGAVQDAIRACQPDRVLDLGCGDGDLFVRLAADPALTELLGLDLCTRSLARLKQRLEAQPKATAKIALRHASMIAPAPDLARFDCVIMVETIEHLPTDRLSQLEHAVFHVIGPKTVVITTPNAEFNTLLGVPSHRMRHPDHQFEWDRARFRDWCARVAADRAYEVRLRDVGGLHPDLGGASQMAVFTRHDPPPFD